MTWIVDGTGWEGDIEVPFSCFLWAWAWLGFGDQGLEGKLEVRVPGALLEEINCSAIWHPFRAKESYRGMVPGLLSHPYSETSPWARQAG